MLDISVYIWKYIFFKRVAVFILKKDAVMCSCALLACERCQTGARVCRVVRAGVLVSRGELSHHRVSHINIPGDGSANTTININSQNVFL